MRNAFLLSFLFLAVIQSSLCLQERRKYMDKRCYREWLTTQTCDWYTNCLQPTFECPTDKSVAAYPMSFGHHMCEKFSQAKSDFPPEGTKWVEGTLLCLKANAMVDLKKKLAGDPMTCETMGLDQFNGHSKCYTDNGFCELFYKFGAVNSAKTMFNLSKILAELMGLKMDVITGIMGNMLNTAKDCVKKLITGRRRRLTKKILKTKAEIKSKLH